MSTTLTEASLTATTTSRALAHELRNRWEIVHAQWIAVPDTLRRAWEQLGERIRLALDLPNKQDLGDLSARLDELDSRLAALIEARRSSTTATAPAPSASPPGADRIAKIAKAAKKGGKTVAEKSVRRPTKK